MNDDDIEVQVSTSFLDGNRYVVYAYYKGDEENRACGTGYFDWGFFSRRLGGESFDTRLKRATCEAIKNLKIEYESNERQKNSAIALNEKVKCYAKDCLECNK